MPGLRFLLLLCILSLTIPIHAYYDPATWPELVTKSDFIGVVRCTTAGGIVAAYQVEEAWKGDLTVGETLTIRISPNPTGVQYPLVLVGQRFVALAYQNKQQAHEGYYNLPLDWREIPVAYKLHKLVLIYPEQQIDLTYWEKWPSPNAFHHDVIQLLNSNPEKQELICLRAQINKYMSDAGLGLDDPFMIREKGPEELEKCRYLQQIRQQIIKLNTVEATVNMILDQIQQKPIWMREVGFLILTRGGSQITYRKLKELTDEEWQLLFCYKQEYSEGMNERLHPSIDPPYTPEKETPPSPEEIVKLRERLLSNRAFPFDIQKLSRYDPETVAQYLVNWTETDEELIDAERGYVIGSSFAYYCGKDRAAYLRRLLEAQDPYIRVAGAIYLCYEDEQAGREALKRFYLLKDDPGVWAALALARRGDKSVIPRLLRVFIRPIDTYNLEDKQHEHLCLRVLELLSNSTAASGIAMPEKLERADGETREKFALRQYEYYIRWWEVNKDRISLTDPWLPILETQKVD